MILKLEQWFETWPLCLPCEFFSNPVMRLVWPSSLSLSLFCQAFNSETDNFKLLYGGHQYHASCANFWINCVEPKPPGLILPDLLWVWSSAGTAGWVEAGGEWVGPWSWVTHTRTLKKMLKITGSSLFIYLSFIPHTDEVWANQAAAVGGFLWLGSTCAVIDALLRFCIVNTMKLVF